MKESTETLDRRPTSKLTKKEKIAFSVVSGAYIAVISSLGFVIFNELSTGSSEARKERDGLVIAAREDGFDNVNVIPQRGDYANLDLAIGSCVLFDIPVDYEEIDGKIDILNYEIPVSSRAIVVVNSARDLTDTLGPNPCL